MSVTSPAVSCSRRLSVTVSNSPIRLSLSMSWRMVASPARCRQMCWQRSRRMSRSFVHQELGMVEGVSQNWEPHFFWTWWFWKILGFLAESAPTVPVHVFSKNEGTKRRNRSLLSEVDWTLGQGESVCCFVVLLSRLLAPGRGGALRGLPSAKKQWKKETLSSLLWETSKSKVTVVHRRLA